MKAIERAIKSIERRRVALSKRSAVLAARIAPIDEEIRRLAAVIEQLRAVGGSRGQAERPAPQVRGDAAEAGKRWRSGQPPTQIARELGISVSTLYGWRDRFGWPKRPTAA